MRCLRCFPASPAPQEANARLQQQQQRAEAEVLAAQQAASSPNRSPGSSAGPEERAARLNAKLQVGWPGSRPSCTWGCQAKFRAAGWVARLSAKLQVGWSG